MSIIKVYALKKSKLDDETKAVLMHLEREDIKTLGLPECSDTNGTIRVAVRYNYCEMLLAFNLKTGTCVITDSNSKFKSEQDLSRATDDKTNLVISAIKQYLLTDETRKRNEGIVNEDQIKRNKEMIDSLLEKLRGSLRKRITMA